MSEIDKVLNSATAHEKANAENLNGIIKARAVVRTPELWAENWFFGVSDNVLSHISIRPVSDEYVGGLVTTFEDFEKQSGYVYGAYWVDGTCVHALYDSHGKLWAACAVDLVWS